MIVIPHSSPIHGLRPDRAAATLGVAVQDHLHDAIVTGALAPGSALKELDLASQLNISSTPIRDALSRLANTGLVDIVSNKAKRVSPVDYGLMVDIAGVRAILFSAVAERAMRHIDEVIIKQLQFRLEALQSALSRADKIAAADSFLRFSTLVVEASASSETIRVYNSRNSYVLRHMIICDPVLNEYALTCQLERLEHLRAKNLQRFLKTTSELDEYFATIGNPAA